MIPLLVFYGHVVFVTALFVRRWQEEGTGEGILSVFFAGLIFFVGWSMTSFIAKLFLDETGVGIVDRDSASLVLLTIAEVVFYYFYFRDGDSPGQGPIREKGA